MTRNVMRHRISSVTAQFIQGISVPIGLLIAVGGGFILQQAYESWRWYNQTYNEYFMRATAEHIVEAFVIFFIATLIVIPERFYGRLPIRVMGFAFGGLSSIAAHITFPMAIHSLSSFFHRGITWEHLVSSALIYSGPALILAVCSAAILMTKAFRAGNQRQDSLR